MINTEESNRRKGKEQKEESENHSQKQNRRYRR